MSVENKVPYAKTRVRVELSQIVVEKLYKHPKSSKNLDTLANVTLHSDFVASTQLGNI